MNLPGWTYSSVRSFHCLSTIKARGLTLKYAQLERAGRVIGPNDLQIAAIALQPGLTLVTHNTREFSRIAELKLDDWES